MRKALVRRMSGRFLGPTIGLLILGGWIGFSLADESKDARITGKVEILVRGFLSSSPQADASGVVIWLERVAPAGEGTPSLKPGVSTLLQRKKTFLPHTLAIPVGEKVIFPNQDDIFHNVFSLSAVQPFDLGLYKLGKVPELIFRKPGVWRIYCNIHSEMFAFIYVFDQPRFAASKKDGTFEIRAVQPGRRRVMYSYRASPAQLLKTIDIEAGARKNLEFRINASKFQLQAHLNKFGAPYKAVTYKEETGTGPF